MCGTQGSNVRRGGRAQVDRSWRQALSARLSVELRNGSTASAPMYSIGGGPLNWRASLILAAVGMLLVGCESGATPVDGAATTPPPTNSTSSTHHSVDGGPWLAFQALYDTTDLGLVRPDGSDSHRIPGGPGNRWHPDWSPDGAAIAYDHDAPSGVDEIWMLRIDGSEERAVTRCVDECIGHQGAAWSPDGKTIGFDGADGPSDEFPDGLCYVGLADVATGETTRILEFPGCQSDEFEGLQEAIFMRFSPDASQMVLQGMGPDDQTAIFIASTTGENLRQLTEWGLGARPDWSADGEWIVFQSLQPEEHPTDAISLYRIRPDGTDLQQLTRRAGSEIDVYPRYTPDGSSILFSRCPTARAANCEARSLTPDGTVDTLLFDDFAPSAVHVIQQPGT